MDQIVLPLFIKFRDFLVSIAPWLLMGLLAAAGIREYLSRSDRGISSRMFVLAGISIAAPSGFTLFMLDYRLAALWFVLAIGFVYAASRLRSPASEGAADLVEAGWIPAGERSDGAGPGLSFRRQLGGLWNALGERFDVVAFWFMGACLVAALLAFYVPFEVGQGLFGRTPWLAILLAAAIGRVLPSGKATEMPLALLLLLKGAYPGAVAAMLFAALPIPFFPGGLRRRNRRLFVAAQFATAAIIGGLVGPALL